MKRVFIIVIICLFAANSYSQKIQRNSCSCYNFFSDEQVQFVKDSIIHYRWNNENGIWSETNFSAYYYNDYFKIKEHLIYIVKQDETIRSKLNRYEYDYSKEGRTMMRNGYLWNEELDSWQEATLAKYQYDSSFTMSERLDLYWDQSYGDWVFNYDFKYNNNFEEKDPDYQRFKWNTGLQVWNNDTKTHCSINNSGNQKFCITFSWKEELKGWNPSNRITYFYNQDGTLQKRTIDNWKEELSSWKPFRIYFYLYDNSGREIEWLSFGWDEDSRDRVGMGRQLYTFDAGGNRYETFRYSWNKELKDWTLYGKQVDYWRDLVKNTLNEIEGNDIKIYPNPFEDYATIEIGDYQNTLKIEMIDMFGRKVRIMNEINGPALTLDRVNLQSGLYLLKVYTTTGVITKRVIIE